MAINKLYISTVDYVDNETLLLDISNYKRVISSDELIDCHTSIQDIKYNFTESNKVKKLNVGMFEK